MASLAPGQQPLDIPDREQADLLSISMPFRKGQFRHESSGVTNWILSPADSRAPDLVVPLKLSSIDDSDCEAFRDSVRLFSSGIIPCPSGRWVRMV